jgi:DNA helicase-2/ATP-dependent DNA helicase PcrA
MDQKIFEAEKNKFDDVLNRIKSARDSAILELTQIGRTNLDRLAELRENGTGGVDFQMFIDQLSQSNATLNLKDRYKKLEEFEYLVKEPYFARIDLKEGDKTESFYIGKFGFSERAPVVTDWRAKVASVYYRYRYPQKDVSYVAPDGKQVRDLTLKRTFEIDNSEFIKFYNNDIQLDETNIVIDKIESRTGGVLEDIVETIQLSQLDIIEADPRQISIVQGCVGSGKSTVAIHKLAHIFFNFPHIIHPEKSILIAKNQILIGYLSTLFPKLGIFDILYKTLRELVVHIVFREELGIKINLDKNIDTADFDLKEVKKLQKKIEKIHSTVQSKLERILSHEDYQSFSGFKYSPSLTSFENLAELNQELQEEILDEKERVKNDPTSMRSWLYKEHIKAMRKLSKEITDLKTQIKMKFLKELVKEYGITGNQPLDYLQTLIYLYTYAELIGFTVFPKFEYCVVDEGQDVSLLEYAVLSKITLRGRFAIFGDLNQSVEADGISDWEDIKEVILDAKSASVFELKTNYRSTQPIISFANNFLKKFTKNHLPQSIARKGPEPLVEYLSSEEDMLSKFKALISEDVQDINKSVGIICKDDQLYKTVGNLIEELDFDKDQLIKLESTKKVYYLPKGIYLMRYNDCKGLEFSKVYVLGENLSKIVDIRTAREAFVAMTRAMNDLCILGTK